MRNCPFFVGAESEQTLAPDASTDKTGRAEMERPLWKTPIERRPGAAQLRSGGLFLCLLLITIPAFAAKFTASLDRDSIVLGESVTLTLSFEGVNPGGMPQLPPIPGLQIAGGVSSGYSSTLADGRMQSVQTYSIPFVANQVGEIQIPAFNIELGGQKLSSQPLKLKVLAEDPTAPPADLGTKSAFLWLVVPRKEFYLGESVVVELRLYLRAGVRNIDGYQPPALSGEGFTSSGWKQGQNFQRRVGGRVFTVVPVLCSLTAAKTGPIRIAPLNANVVLNPPDVFEGFFGRRSETERVALTLNEQTLQVLPLPTENQPAGFNGAVGQYTMSVNVGPTNVATGDPITVKVQISGRGNLNGLMLPEQTAWQDFKAYPPTANVETTDAWGLQGAKTFEQIVAPQSTDIKELPPLTFSYFDPETKLYRTLSYPGVPLTVRPGGNAPTPVIAATPRSSNETSPPPQQDIVPIKTRLGNVRPPDSASGTRKVFLALNVVPMLAFIGALVWRKRSDTLANNPRLRRQRLVAAIIDAGLKRLQTFASENKSDEFFAELVHLLQEKLGERLNCPASAITEAVIDEKLRPRGVPDTTLEELHALFQSCNLARYAPVKSSEELKGVIPRLEAALKKLEEVKA
jgi:hypothetical protein